MAIDSSTRVIAKPHPQQRIDWLDLAARYILLATLVFLIVGFSIALPDRFPTSQHLHGLVANQMIILILAVGTVFPLAVGEFDLSIGNVVGFTNVLVIGLISKSSVPIPLAIGVALAVAAVAGLANGLLLTRLRASSLIATLATGSVLAGLTFWYTGGQTLFENIPVEFTRIARASVGDITLPVFYGFALTVIAGLVLTYARVGRRIYVVGGNRTAAALAGIHVSRTIVLAFMISAVMAGIAGIILASRLGSGDPAVGPSLLLPTYAASFLGATAFRPGRFNVAGTVVAVFLLAVASSGLQLYGVPSWSENVFNGVALAAAVGLSSQVADLRASRARRSRLRALEADPEHAAGD